MWDCVLDITKRPSGTDLWGVPTPRALPGVIHNRCASGTTFIHEKTPDDVRASGTRRAGGTAIVDSPGQRPGAGGPPSHSPGGTSCGAIRYITNRPSGAICLCSQSPRAPPGVIHDTVPPARPRRPSLLVPRPSSLNRSSYLAPKLFLGLVRKLANFAD